MELLVAADDRTGAIETAGALADARAGSVRVVTEVAALTPADDVVVVDLASRHLQKAEAARRATEAATFESARSAHKIDSTLRGNWAAELVARHERTGAPVLVVPALPSLGRTCVDGVVLDDGRPVHLGAAAIDVGGRLSTSSPGELLRAEGAGEVAGLRHLDDVERWLAAPAGVAVADAATNEEVSAIVERWLATPHVTLAGTSEAIAATLRRSAGAVAADAPEVTGAVVVVCGSVHPVARRQIEHAALAGAVVAPGVDSDVVEAVRHGHPVILASALPVGAVDVESAVHTAHSLAAMVDELGAAAHVGALVVLGGDTAAAVLGHAPFDVHGTVAPGTAWGRDRRGRTVITRAGGFGGPDALVELLWSRLAR